MIFSDYVNSDGNNYMLIYCTATKPKKEITGYRQNIQPCTFISQLSPLLRHAVRPIIKITPCFTFSTVPMRYIETGDESEGWVGYAQSVLHQEETRVGRSWERLATTATLPPLTFENTGSL